jgi:hypothetical protein
MKKLILIIVRLFLVNALIISVYVDSFGQCTDITSQFSILNVIDQVNNII